MLRLGEVRQPRRDAGHRCRRDHKQPVKRFLLVVEGLHVGLVIIISAADLRVNGGLVLGDDGEDRIVLGCVHDYPLPFVQSTASLNRAI
jgi:hypothetical protein